MGISFLENGVAYEAMGEGPLVVCSPGMGDRRDAFRPLAELLVEAGFRVALVDLRGHGDSRGTWDVFGDEATASDLIGVIERLGGGPAVIAGASCRPRLPPSPPGDAPISSRVSCCSAPSCVTARAP